MNLSAFTRVVRLNWLFIVAVTVMGLLVGLAYTLTRVPQYQSTSQSFISVGTAGSLTDFTQGGDFAQRIVASYAQVAVSPLVLDAVAADPSVRSSSAVLAGGVQAQAVPGTVILEVTATDASPGRAADIANLIALRLETAVRSLSSEGTADGVIEVSQISPATPSANSIGSRTPTTVVLAGLAGLVGAVALLVARSLISNRVTTSTEAASIANLPVLAAVPRATPSGRRAPPAVAFGTSDRGRIEAARKLRTNLDYTDFRTGGSTLLVTSATQGEGKTTLALQASIALADAGLRVLLVDADLRRSTLSQTLGLAGDVGLAQVLAGRVALDDAIQSWSESGRRLDVLLAGDTPPNPAELLQSEDMGDVLRTISGSYDRVVIDCAPLLPVADAAVLAPRVTGTVLVCALNRTARPELEGAVASLRQVHARVLGLVVNFVPRRDGEAGLAYARSSSTDAVDGFSILRQ